MASIAWTKVMFHMILIVLVRPLISKAISGALAFNQSRWRSRLGRAYSLLAMTLLFTLVHFLVSPHANFFHNLPRATICAAPPATAQWSLGRLLRFPAQSVAAFVSGRSQASVLNSGKLSTLEAYSELAADLWFNGFSVLQALRYAYYVALGAFIDSRLLLQTLVPAYVLWFVWDWAYYVYQDYAVTFKDLGQGGPAPTFAGWVRARALTAFANVDVMRPIRLPPHADPYRGRLGNLPQREGERPTILGVAPRRQVDSRVPPNILQQLELLMARYVQEPNGDGGDHVEVRRSFLEPDMNGLRRRLQVPMNADGGPADARASFNGPDEFGGEIYHPRRDGTSHVVLHPEDCRAVMEAGWGERHPLATDAWYWKTYFHWARQRRPSVPAGLVTLYAPRHQGEFGVVARIIEAALYNETGGRLFPVDADTFPIPPAPAAVGAANAI